ncbi:hypothetical protein ACRRTK_005844 [Alexandromys fortis]
MSKDPTTQKLRTDLLNIIREKNLAHPVIQNFSYETFQQKVLHFLESHLDDTEPYLLTMAKKALKSESAASSAAKEEKQPVQATKRAFKTASGPSDHHRNQDSKGSFQSSVHCTRLRSSFCKTGPERSGTF